MLASEDTCSQRTNNGHNIDTTQLTHVHTHTDTHTHAHSPSNVVANEAASVAEAVQHFITAMDQIKLNLVAIDQVCAKGLHHCHGPDQTQSGRH